MSREFNNWNGDQTELNIFEESKRRERDAIFLLLTVSSHRARSTYRRRGGISIDNPSPMHEAFLRAILNQSLYEHENKRDENIVLNVQMVKATKEDEEHSCSICMNNFSEGENKSVLECSHMFHYECIQEWGKHKQECPLCRSEIDVC